MEFLYSLERLEDRLLLDSGPLTIGDAPGAMAKSLCYFDGDGTQVTVRMTGGLATISWLDDATNWSVANGVASVTEPSSYAEIRVIDLVSKTQSSRLDVQAKIPAGSQADNFVRIGQLLATAEQTRLGRINAPQMLIYGAERQGRTAAMDIPFGVGSINIYGCNGALDLGGTANDRLTFAAGGPVESDLIFGGTITQLTAGSWWSDVLSAEAFGKIVITGYTWDGQFQSHLASKVTARSGSIGSLQITGGVFDGELNVENGSIGSIRLTGKSFYTNGDNGARYADLHWANLLGSINVGSVRGTSIGEISVVGGGIGFWNWIVVQSVPLSIRAKGSIRSIRSEGFKCADYEVDDRGRLRQVPRYEYTGAYVDIETDGSIGPIKTVGSDLRGSIKAKGDVGAVSLRAERTPDAQGIGYIGGNMDIDIEARRVGNMSVAGGYLIGEVIATSVGSVTCTAKTIDAKLVTYRDSSGTWQDVFSGGAYGGNIRLHLRMSDPAARLGAVTSVGGHVRVEGAVNFDPAKARLTSRPVAYIQQYDSLWDEESQVYNYVANRAVIGGQDQVENRLGLWGTFIPFPADSSLGTGSGSDGLGSAMQGDATGDGSVSLQDMSVLIGPGWNGTSNVLVGLTQTGGAVGSGLVPLDYTNWVAVPPSDDSIMLPGMLPCAGSQVLWLQYQGMPYVIPVIP